MHKIRILWYWGIRVLDSAAEPRVNTTATAATSRNDASRWNQAADSSISHDASPRWFFCPGSSLLLILCLSCINHCVYSRAARLARGVHQKLTPVLSRPCHSVKMGPVRIRYSSHDFTTQSTQSLDRAGWQAKMASIEIWIPWRNAHTPNLKHLRMKRVCRTSNWRPKRI